MARSYLHRELRCCQAILRLGSGAIEEVPACSFIFVYVLLDFPQGFLSGVISHHSLLKGKEYAIEVLVLTLCFKLCLEFDNLSLFAQSMGCPKRLIKTEPDQLPLKGLLHLKTLMHTHTHTYFVIL